MRSSISNAQGYRLVEMLCGEFGLVPAIGPRAGELAPLSFSEFSGLGSYRRSSRGTHTVARGRLLFYSRWSPGTKGLVVWPRTQFIVDRINDIIMPPN